MALRASSNPAPNITGGTINGPATIGATTRIPGTTRLNNVDIQGNPTHTNGSNQGNYVLSAPTIVAGATGSVTALLLENQVFGTAVGGVGAHWVAIKPYIRQVNASALNYCNVTQPTYDMLAVGSITTVNCTAAYMAANAGTISRYNATSGGTIGSNAGTITEWVDFYGSNLAGFAGGGTITTRFFLWNDDPLKKSKTAGDLLVGSVGTISTAAALEVASTTQGVLFPRMTTAQKNAIGSPPAGLVVYDTTLNKLCVRTAAAWETITSV